MRPLYAGLIVLLFSTASFAQESQPTTRPSNDEVSRPAFGMSISGGVSLGAYEAGLNWVLVRQIRATNAELSVVTGASAGNINAFLTAAEWCQSDAVAGRAAHFTESWFWKAWVPLGLTQLFPGNRTCAEYHRDLEAWSAEKPTDCANPNDLAYGPDDGMFSRKAGEPVLTELAQFFATPGAFRSCQLPVGVTVTRQEPVDLKISSTLSVPTHRYVAPLMACAGPNGLRFKNYHPDGCDAISLQGAPTFSDLGKVLYSPTDARGNIEFDQVRKVMLASSAFPVAFKPMNVTYCEAPEEAYLHSKEKGNQSVFDFQDAPDLKAGLMCDENRATSDFFLDGGVFDNVPLSLAVYILDSKRIDGAPKTDLIYLDPDFRRLKTKPPGASAPIRPGLGQAFRFAESFVGVSRRYELQFLARNRKFLEHVELPATSRFGNIFGDYLANFSAFFAQAFREVDFYNGVYDGARHWALKKCDPSDARCVATSMRETLDQLAPNSDIRNHDLRFVYLSLMAEECALLNATCDTATDTVKPHRDIVILAETQLRFRQIEEATLRCQAIPGWDTKLGKNSYRECLNRSGITFRDAKNVSSSYFRTLVRTLRDETGYERAFEDRLKLDADFRKTFSERQIKDEKAFIRSYDMTVRTLLAEFLHRSRRIEQKNTEGASIYVSNAAEFALSTWLDLANPKWRAFPSTIQYYPTEPWYYTAGKGVIFNLFPHSISIDLTSDQRSREYEWRFVSTPAFFERLTFSLVASTRFIGRGKPLIPGGQKNNLLGGVATMLYLNPLLAFETVIKGGLESESFRDPTGGLLPSRSMPGVDFELRGVIADHVTVSPGMTLLDRGDGLDPEFRVSIGFRDVNGFLYWTYRFLLAR